MLGLGQKQKRLQVFQWLKDQNCSIYMLQETHLTKQRLEEWKQDWGGNIIHSGNSPNSEGVCILFNPKINIKIEHVTDILSGRILACEVNLENIIVTIVNIYGPNKDNTHIFEKLNTFLLEHNDQTFIIGGDFNTPLNCTIDQLNGRLNTNKKCRNKINQIIQTNDLIDIWREFHKNRKQFTWHSNTKPVIHSRLDYFLVSNKIRNVMKSCNIKMVLKRTMLSFC